MNRVGFVRVGSGRGFVVAMALLFLAALVATLAAHTSMSTMSDMPMPGGWTMSPMWTRMCGRTWIDSAVSFVRMWIAMMTAMMLPVIAPTLWRYRATCETHANRRTVYVGMAYLTVWAAFGIAVFPLGVAMAALVMHAPRLAHVVPIGAGGVMLIAGAGQFTAWKARRLACCRHAWRNDRCTATYARSVWQYGLRMGLHCVCCCAGPTAVLLAVGMMDLRAMALVTAAIAAERLLPAGERVAHATGIVAIGVGFFMIARLIGVV